MDFNLINEIKKYTPKDEVEKNDVKKIIEFLDNNKNCFSRINLKGHITASAIIMHNNGNVLLNHHKKLDKWIFWGGHSDGDVNSLNVAKREVAEECGITDLNDLGGKIFDIDIQIIPENITKNEPQHYHYDIRFLFIVNSNYFSLSKESIDAKWVSIDQAEQMVINANDIRALEKAREIFLKNK